MSGRDVMLALDNVSMSFSVSRGRQLKAVEDVSITIMRGETFGLVGESGCGKTTCGRVALGLYDPTGGHVYYKGSDISKLDPSQTREFRRDAQMIFQDPYACLDPRMSIGSIVSEGLDAHFVQTKKERHEEVASWLSRVGLTSDYASRFPHELSGGQRQRVGIARALAVKPSFIVCDEPIAALDVSIQAQVINLLMQLQSDLSLTYLFISHDLSMVRHISDKIGVMYLGSLVECADAAAYSTGGVHPYTQALFSSIPAADPDVRWIDERIRLVGEIPSPIDAPEGCKFRTRCSRAQKICSESRPALKDVGGGHLVACHCI